VALEKEYQLQNVMKDGFILSLMSQILFRQQELFQKSWEKKILRLTFLILSIISSSKILLKSILQKKNPLPSMLLCWKFRLNI
jgi:hypothetical protein